MPGIDHVELARHLDRVRRRVAPCKPGVSVHELSTGWLSIGAPGPLAEYPSASMDRIYWLAPPRVLTRDDLKEAWAAARSLGRAGIYIWLAPWAWDENVEAMLTAAGAARWPYVEYIALARAARKIDIDRKTAFTVRRVEADEVERVMDGTRAWYRDEGTDGAVRMARDGTAEIHAAFDGDRVVAVGLLAVDGEWAYLFAAATAKEARGRGAQTALIASRVERAAALGVRWCTSETNTTVAISLANLRRCGFADAIKWRVYKWVAASG